MLAYSGRGRFVVQPIDLNRLIEDTTHLLQISIAKTCVLRFHLGPSLPAVNADATQLRQVIMNLVINASEAIASQWQGKHAAFNDALHSTGGRLDSASIRAAADRAGVNWPRLQSDLKTHKNEIDALLARTNRQAAAIGLSGTPGLIIGNYLVPGALDLIALRTAVARVRADVSKVK